MLCPTELRARRRQILQGCLSSRHGRVETDFLASTYPGTRGPGDVQCWRGVYESSASVFMMPLLKITLRLPSAESTYSDAFPGVAAGAGAPSSRVSIWTGRFRDR